MKKIISKILIFTLILMPFANANAWISITVNGDWTTTYYVDWIEVREATRWDLFSELFSDLTAPSSYEYIDLKYKDLKKGNPEYDLFQKIVYHNIFPNTSSNLNLDKKITIWETNKLVTAIYSYNFSVFKNADLTKTLSTYDIKLIKDEIAKVKKQLSLAETDWNVKFWILYDIYETIIQNHFDKDKLSKEDLLDWAISGLASSTQDKYTTYFPPTLSESFESQINWNFEWIWAYVIMRTPWEFVVEWTIPGSPAEKAWIQAWDIFLKVWDKEVLKTSTQAEVISWIKWEKWTNVTIKIKRDWKIFEQEITRDVVDIKEINSEIKRITNYYMNISIFSNGITNQFVEELEKIKENEKIKKIIIDLRWNPGWVLGEVSSMLDYIVPKWEPNVVVKYSDWTKEILTSKWKEIIDFSKYQVVVLIDWNSASASEIMAWTMRDYLPNLKIIGTTSYGKGSVQRTKNYKDGSLFKYTIAKWFTWWSETTIDWVWIIPDDEIQFNKNDDGLDNQLKEALDI